MKTGILFTGGKFPGYNYNQTALEMISELHTKWWALDANMINKVHPDNNLPILSYSEIDLAKLWIGFHPEAVILQR